MTADLRQAAYLAIVGPTASGKSTLAMRLAASLDGELVNCDSVQIYRGFVIGAAKPSPEEQAQVPHHLIDIRDWHESYDAAAYARDAKESIAAIRSRGKLPIVVGGTGLYLRALWGMAFQDDLPRDPVLRQDLERLSNQELLARLRQLDPERAQVLHENDRFRLLRAVELCTLLGQPVSEVWQGGDGDRGGAYAICLQPSRRDLHERIRLRTEAMLAQGLLDEVRGLLAQGVAPTAKPMQAIGYRQCVQVLQGNLEPGLLAAKIAAATRQYAKRQCTLFRGWTFDEVLLQLH